LANHRDLITLDIGPVLRKAFANYAHSLLMQKEREIMALFNELLPHGSVAGVDNRDLVHASVPVTRFRQIANWCNNQPHKDQQEELNQLKELPRKWLAGLRGFLEE
jgi:hypothetical protein